MPRKADLARSPQGHPRTRVHPRFHRRSWRRWTTYAPSSGSPPAADPIWSAPSGPSPRPNNLTFIGQQSRIIRDAPGLRSQAAALIDAFRKGGYAPPKATPAKRCEGEPPGWADWFREKFPTKPLPRDFDYLITVTLCSWGRAKVLDAIDPKGWRKFAVAEGYPSVSPEETYLQFCKRVLGFDKAFRAHQARQKVEAEQREREAFEREQETEFASFRRASLRSGHPWPGGPNVAWGDSGGLRVRGQRGRATGAARSQRREMNLIFLLA
jgi:hypothetical protein